MAYEDFLSRLNPKVASALKTAATTEIERLPLASRGLTDALGGGIGKGRVTLTYGPPSSGKSALWLQSIAAWQDMGLVCGWADVEGAFEPSWAKRLGVKTDELVLVGSKSSGRLEADIRPLLEAKIDVMVVDSISDILPEVFVGKGGEMNEQEDRKQIGSQAKAITALVNGIHYLNQGTAVGLISQTTTFMGQSYVEQVPHGGQKVQFASSQIIRLNSSASPNAQIEEDVWVDGHVFKRPVARDVDWLIKKNKLGSPFRTGTYRFRYEGERVGIDVTRELIDEAIAFDVIRKGGAWFSFGDQKWQGQNALTDEVRSDEGLQKEIISHLEAAKSGGEIA